MLSVEQHEEKARDYLARHCAAADLDPEYPAKTGTVVKFLSALEYLVDAPAINDYIERGRIIPPQMTAGRMTWQAADIVDLIAQLESDRRWKPFSPRHHHKKTKWEICRELSLTGQAPPVFSDLDTFTMPELLGLIVQADDREVREMIRLAIQLKVDEKAREDQRNASPN